MTSLHVVSHDHCFGAKFERSWRYTGGGGVAIGTGCNLIGQCVGGHVAPAGKECAKTRYSQAIPPFFERNRLGLVGRAARCCTVWTNIWS